MELEKLKEVFHPSELEWRVQSADEKDGKIWALVLCYVDNRAIQNMLDAVCGAGNWQNRYEELGSGTKICNLSIRLESGEWITKSDGAGNTDIEADKGGLSSAMKRAAVQWGIGRYLYNLEATFAIVSGKGKNKGKTKSGKYFKWDPPPLPAWALPAGYAPDAKPEAGQAEPEEKQKGDLNALFAAIKQCKSGAALNKIEARIGDRSWTEEEQIKIDAALQDMRDYLNFAEIA